MRERGRLQFGYVNGAWVDSAMGRSLDRFVAAWLERRLLARPYRWLEDGVAIYLPPCR